MRPFGRTCCAVAIALGIVCAVAGLCRHAAALNASAGEPCPAQARPIADDVYALQDDADNWGGVRLGITNQHGDKYWAKKVFDLGAVPEDFWNASTDVRLSAFFCVSFAHDLKPADGPGATVEIVVNGTVHAIRDRSGLPQHVTGKSMSREIRWHDFVLPKQEFVRGANEVLFRMRTTPDKPADDGLYLGIDNSVPTRHSWVKLNAQQPWRRDRLNAAGAPGEYRARLYLLRGARDFSASWKPAAAAADDPFGMLDYAGVRDGRPQLEWNPLRLDPGRPLRVTVEIADGRPFELQWLSVENERQGPLLKARGPRFETQLAASPASRPGGVRLSEGLPLVSVKVEGARDFRPLPTPIDMAPRIEQPAGRPVDRRPKCRIDAEKIELSNDNLRCEFRRSAGRLQLASLYNELAGAEMVRSPAASALALVEVDGRRYAASRDFVCRGVTPLPQGQGFTAVMNGAAAPVELVLSVWIDGALHWGLKVTNRAATPLAFKTAFPHLSGLAISKQPAEDYFFYPLGCVVSQAPALIRKGYGDYQALYQLMDVFSPQRGAGLAAWCTDADGRYKVLALRNCVPGRREVSADKPALDTAAEFTWTNSLDAVPGVGMTWEYLRRTRGSGESFAPKEVALQAHAGDWHAAMRQYARWCHTIWKFRPYPSRLTPIINTVPPGLGKDTIFRDGRYQTGFIRPRTDCIELQCWWEWSPLGPKGVPLDQFPAKMPEGAARKWWYTYLPKDPVTGELMFNSNPGDYDGYNQRFGGLATFRQAIKTYRQSCPLVTLYTDFLRVDYNTKCGRAWGELWGMVQADGTYRQDYDAWRMCHDVAEYRAFVARTVARVLRETGADGVRLDEYGRAGLACFSQRHQHTFSEWGATEWQRGVAEATRLVRQAMDQIDPRLVLSTEHPGYDFLMPSIEGCITYDLSLLASPLRPVECNLQRFYFPECKPLEFDVRGDDPAFRLPAAAVPASVRLLQGGRLLDLQSWEDLP